MADKVLSVDPKDLKHIEDNLRFLSQEITSKAILEALGVQIKDIIFLNTSAGQDADGKSFVDYDPAYAEQHGKTIVNLTDTGTMLNAMTQKVFEDNNLVKVFFANIDHPNFDGTVAELAEIHNDLGAGKSKKIREFFGLDNFNLGEVIATYQDHVAKVTKKANQ